MTKLELAINDAVEKGGYELPWVTAKQIPKLSRDNLSTILLDPKFWAALGKTRRWRLEARGDNGELYQRDEWPRQMHRLIDHLIADNSIESFFETLM